MPGKQQHRRRQLIINKERNREARTKITKREIMQKKINYLLLLSILIVLSGCSFKSSPQYFERVTEVSKNDYFANIEISKLKQYTANVNSNYAGILLTIPENKLFYANSTNLTPDGRSILNHVVKLVSYYDVEAITVTNIDFASNDPRVDNAKKSAITKNRALKIEQYLWSQNVDSSVIYSIGKLLRSSQTNNSNTGYAVINFDKHFKYN